MSNRKVHRKVGAHQYEKIGNEQFAKKANKDDPLGYVPLSWQIKHTFTLVNGFNNLYIDKGNHPGDPYYFFANVPNDRVEANLAQHKRAVAVTPAYRRNGEVLEGHTAIFYVPATRPMGFQ